MISQQPPEQNQAVKRQQKGTAEDFNQVENVIAVMSGKGGVGKSFVTGLLASGLRKIGFKVGILDADITGPSIPMLFGLHNKVEVGEFGILPLESRTGIKVISMNLLLPKEDAPVIWRGPLVSRAIQQLWGDVMWGELDVLLIDLPPGTSDATLTIMQSLPVNGLVMVTTPQSLASMVVRKAVHMAQIVDVNITGVIENMAFFRCLDTGKEHQIFGRSHSTEVAEAANAPLLARIPIDLSISDLCDAGRMEDIYFEGLHALLSEFLHFAPAPLSDKRVAVADERQDKTHTNQKESPIQPSIEGSEEEYTINLSEFPPVAQEIIKNQENMGYFEHPDLVGRVTGCCGDSIQIELLLEGNRIKDARFSTDGCSATIACGGIITRLIKGKKSSDAMKLDQEVLVDALGGFLPQGHLHCAGLAIKTLRETLNQGKKDA